MVVLPSMVISVRNFKSIKEKNENGYSNFNENLKENLKYKYILNKFNLKKNWKCPYNIIKKVKPLFTKND